MVKKWSSEIRRLTPMLYFYIYVSMYIYSSYIASLIIHHTLHSISLRLLNSTATQGFAVRQRIQCVYNSSVFQLAKFIYTHTDTQTHTHIQTDTQSHITKWSNHWTNTFIGWSQVEKKNQSFRFADNIAASAAQSQSAVTVRSARSEFQCQSQCSPNASKCQSCRQYIISNRCTCSCVCVCVFERNNFQFLFDFYLYTKSKRNGKIEKPAATVRAASACEMKMSWPVATASTEAAAAQATAATQATTMENRLYHIQVLELVPVSVAALHLSGRSWRAESLR